MSEIKDEYIQQAAYFLWEKDGCPTGNDLEYWNRAKTELSKCKSCCSKSTAKVVSTKRVEKKKAIIKTTAKKKA